MKAGEGSSRRRRKRRTRSVAISYVGSVKALSREGRRTHFMANQSRCRPLNSIPGTYSTVFDNTCPYYRWLFPGWLVEERRMLYSNRLYRYYYDPMGKMYGFRWKVEQRCKDIEKYVRIRNHVVIVIDE